MKKTRKIIILLIVSIFVCFNFVYAENETGEQNTSTTTESNTIVENTTSENNTKKENETTTQESNTVDEQQEKKSDKESTETEKKITNTNTNTNSVVNNNKNSTSQTKSNNADLANLGITPYDFSGFSANKTNYNVSVPNSVKSVEVYAKARDAKATISGTGKVELKEGQNTIKVEVTAEDGTKKTYSIIITKLKEGETLTTKNETNSKEVSLKNIIIDGLELNPNFDANTYKYSVNIEGEQTSINIKAESTQNSNIVQIIGNTNLVDGENIVTIIVSDAKEQNTVIYEVTVNKNLEKMRALQKEKEDAENFENFKKWGLRILAFVVILGLMAFIIIRHKKSQDEDFEDEEMPKSLRRKIDEENEEEREVKKKKKRKSKGKHGK